MCDDPELIEALKQAQRSQRGYADFDSWPDKSVKELGLGRDFNEALAATFGLTLSGIHVSPPNCDPPDLLAFGQIGIEVTELVDQALVQQAVLERRAGNIPAKYRDWTADQLLARLRQIVRQRLELA